MKTIYVILAFSISLWSLGQASGNVNQQKQVSFSDQNINVGLSSGKDIVISVKGMANVKADSYVAIFNLTQVGKTTEEVNSLMEARIKAVEKKIKENPQASLFVDMLTFVPVYEYEVEKKIFSKKTYNEIPVGFELKKNLHIEFKDPNYLNDLITVCSQNEIYDLVRVDYFSNQLEAVKKELITKAKAILKEKQKHYQDIMNVEFTNWDRQFGDGFVLRYPTEMYKTYQVYNSSSLPTVNKGNINRAEKVATLYYQPVIDKEFDFVIHPKIVEPVIQVMYEIKLRLIRPEKEQAKPMPEKQTPAVEKSYYIVTPAGDVKKLEL